MLKLDYRSSNDALYLTISKYESLEKYCIDIFESTVLRIATPRIMVSKAISSNRKNKTIFFRHDSLIISVKSKHKVNKLL